MYANGYDVEEIKRFGRWTSNAVHSYLWETRERQKGMAAAMTRPKTLTKSAHMPPGGSQPRRRRAGSEPAVQVAAGILAMMPKGAEAAGGMELLPPVGEDTSYFFFVVLLVVLCFTVLAGACLCGYALGRCQAKIEYIREPVYVEKPFYIEKPADTTKAKTEDYIQDPPRQRKLEAETVYLSPNGDCFHTYKECNGLRGVSPAGLTSKRACSFCGGGPGRKKGT